MKKPLLKKLGWILTICIVLNMIVLSVYSAEVDNNYPSTYTYTGDYRISGGIQDGKWFYNSGDGVLDIYGSGSLGNTAAPWYGNVPWKDYSENVKESGLEPITPQTIE